jgi:hypothetical protein
MSVKELPGSDPAYDDFERALLGDNWTIYNGDVGIVGAKDLGILSKSGPMFGLGLVTWSATTFSADQFSEIVISPDVDRKAIFQVFVRRRTGDKQRYGLHCRTIDRDGRQIAPTWEIKLDGGPQGAVLAEVAARGPEAGDTIRIEVVGNGSRGFHNGVELLDATDSALTEPGEPGMALHVRWVESMPTPVYSCWRGGSLNLSTPIGRADLPRSQMR